jgi:predicted DNA-binding protein YlxM (UPF0122 family)
MKQQKFWTKRLFEKQNEVQMSFQEIADFFGISRASANNYIKRDVKAQFIEKWSYFSASKRTRHVLQGKNVYKLRKT